MCPGSVPLIPTTDPPSGVFSGHFRHAGATNRPLIAHSKDKDEEDRDLQLNMISWSGPLMRSKNTKVMKITCNFSCGCHVTSHVVAMWPPLSRFSNLTSDHHQWGKTSTLPLMIACYQTNALTVGLYHKTLLMSLLIINSRPCFYSAWPTCVST